MVLTIDRDLLTFEDDMQRGGATEHFSVTNVPPEAYMLAEACQDPVEIQVAYPSKRRAFLQKLGMYQQLGDEMRTVRYSFDAGEKYNREWCKALQGTLSARYD